MTTQELLVQLKDNYAFDNDIASSLGESPTDAQLVPYLNWAIRILARKIKQFSIKIPFTFIAGTYNYSLNASSGGFISTSDCSEVTKIHRVYVNGLALKKPDNVTCGLWSFQEIERVYPNWVTASNSTPQAAAQLGHKVMFYPPPTGSESNTFFVAEYLPKDLSTTDLTQIPDLPLELHECIAYLASIKIAAPQLTEAESFQRLNLYNGFINDTIDALKKQNEKDLLSYGSTLGIKIRKFMRI